MIPQAVIGELLTVPLGHTYEVCLQCWSFHMFFSISQGWAGVWLAVTEVHTGSNPPQTPRGALSPLMEFSLCHWIGTESHSGNGVTFPSSGIQGAC